MSCSYGLCRNQTKLRVKAITSGTTSKLLLGATMCSSLPSIKKLKHFQAFKTANKRSLCLTKIMMCSSQTKIAMLKHCLVGIKPRVHALLVKKHDVFKPAVYLFKRRRKCTLRKIRKSWTSIQRMNNRRRKFYYS